MKKLRAIYLEICIYFPFFFLLIFNGKFLTIIVKSVEKLSSVFAKWKRTYFMILLIEALEQTPYPSEWYFWNMWNIRGTFIMCSSKHDEMRFRILI